MLATLPPAQAAVAADAGALVTFFGRATLGQVEGSAEELGRAGSLLGDAMAMLEDPQHGQMMRAIPLVRLARFPGFPVREADLPALVAEVGGRA